MHMRGSVQQLCAVGVFALDCAASVAKIHVRAFEHFIFFFVSACVRAVSSKLQH